MPSAWSALKRNERSYPQVLAWAQGGWASTGQPAFAILPVVFDPSILAKPNLSRPLSLNPSQPNYFHTQQLPLIIFAYTPTFSPYSQDRIIKVIDCHTTIEYLDSRHEAVSEGHPQRRVLDEC